MLDCSIKRMAVLYVELRERDELEDNHLTRFPRCTIRGSIQ